MKPVFNPCAAEQAFHTSNMIITTFEDLHQFYEKIMERKRFEK